MRKHPFTFLLIFSCRRLCRPRARYTFTCPLCNNLIFNIRCTEELINMEEVKVKIFSCQLKCNWMLWELFYYRNVEEHSSFRVGLLHFVTYINVQLPCYSINCSTNGKMFCSISTSGKIYLLKSKVKNSCVFRTELWLPFSP
jgi:hypothetical protein